MNICYAKFVPQVTNIATFTMVIKGMFVRHDSVFVACVILSAMLCLSSIPLLCSMTIDRQ